MMPIMLVAKIDILYDKYYISFSKVGYFVRIRKVVAKNVILFATNCLVSYIFIICDNSFVGRKFIINSPLKI